MAMTEVEYVVVSNEAKEALWLGIVVHTFRKMDPNRTSVIYNSNQRCACSREAFSTSLYIKTHRSQVPLCLGLCDKNEVEPREEFDDRQCLGCYD